MIAAFYFIIRWAIMELDFWIKINILNDLVYVRFLKVKTWIENKILINSTTCEMKRCEKWNQYYYHPQFPSATNLSSDFKKMNIWCFLHFRYVFCASINIFKMIHREKKEDSFIFFLFTNSSSNINFKNDDYFVSMIMIEIVESSFIIIILKISFMPH